MSNNINELILNEIQNTNRLLARIVTRGLTQNESIDILSCAGFQSKVIAEYLGVTRNAVSIALTRMRKDKKKVSTGRK